MENDQKVSPDIAYMQNLAVAAAALELGGAVMMELAGGDELSNQLGGKTQQQADYQELLAARIGSKLGN